MGGVCVDSQGLCGFRWCDIPTLLMGRFHVVPVALQSLLFSLHAGSLPHPDFVKGRKDWKEGRKLLDTYFHLKICRVVLRVVLVFGITRERYYRGGTGNNEKKNGNHPSMYR